MSGISVECAMASQEAQDNIQHALFPGCKEPYWEVS